MNHTTGEDKKKHDGRNVKRIREILQVKQISLANALGEDWNQKKVSQLEDKEVIDDKLMEEIAGILKVPVEAIRNFDEDATVNYFNTFNDNATSHVIGNYGTYNFNPIEKWVESLDENKKLVEKNEQLYERLLQVEREKVEMMQQIIAKK